MQLADYAEVICRPRDAGFFAELGFSPTLDPNRGAGVRMTHHKPDEFKAALFLKPAVPFIACCSIAGAAMLFASDGERLAAVRALGKYPAIEVAEDGRPLGLSYARDYWRVRAATIRHLAQEMRPPQLRHRS